MLPVTCLPHPPTKQAGLGVTRPQRGASALLSPLLFIHQLSQGKGGRRRCSAQTHFPRSSLGTLELLCLF